MNAEYIEVKMPWLAPEEPVVEVDKWLVEPGQRLEIDQDILQLLVNGAEFMLPSPVDGELTQCCVTPKESLYEGQILAVVRID